MIEECKELTGEAQKMCFETIQHGDVTVLIGFVAFFLLIAACIITGIVRHTR